MAGGLDTLNQWWDAAKAAPGKVMDFVNPPPPPPRELPISWETTPETAKTGISGDPSYWDRHPLDTIPLSQRPKNLPTSIPVYRADPRGRFGGKRGLETQPIPQFAGDTPDGDPLNKSPTNSSRIAMQELFANARLLGAAAKLGLPSMSPDEAMAFIIKEGRSDLGYNGFATWGHESGTPKDNKYHTVLAKHYHLPRNQLGLLATIEQKHAVANRLGIPFAEAWNGSGRSELGVSGADYARNWQHHLQAARAPENKALRDLFMRGYSEGQKHGLPLRKQHDPDYGKYAAGGPVEIDDGNPAKRRRML